MIAHARSEAVPASYVHSDKSAESANAMLETRRVMAVFAADVLTLVDVVNTLKLLPPWPSINVTDDGKIEPTVVDVFQEPEAGF